MPDILRDAKIWAGGYDISGDLNSVVGVLGVEEQDGTAFGHAARGVLPGLRLGTIEAAGFWRSGLDAVLHPFGLQDEVVTIAPLAGAFDDKAFFMRVTQGKYDIGGDVGDAYPFELSAVAKGMPLIRGRVAKNSTGVSSSGNGTESNHGTLAAGDKMYAALHVLAASGTLDVTVESDTTGFASPITRMTFAQATTVGSQLLSFPGAISDTFWRAEWTVTGTFDFVVILGRLAA